MLRTWLADTAGAVEALRKYAASAIPLDDAVEAEALAQSLDPASLDDGRRALDRPIDVDDIETLHGPAGRQPRAPQMPVDLARHGQRR